MGDKVKGWLSIFLMSVTIFMMTTTKYMHALGDYILEGVGLRAWTGDYTGIHLTVIYFSIPYVIGVILVKPFIPPVKYLILFYRILMVGGTLI